MFSMFTSVYPFRLECVCAQLALIVAQTRDRNNRLSGIKLMALKEGLEKVYFKAKQLKGMKHSIFC